MFPSKTIHTDGIRAGVMSSFGFGQVGGTALIVNPRYLFGALEPTFYEQYKERNRIRALQSYKAMSDMMIKNSLVKVKEHPPFTPENERQVLLNSMARVTYDPKTSEYSFKGKLAQEAPLDLANLKIVSNAVVSHAASEGSNVIGVGVDQGKQISNPSAQHADNSSELISSVPSHNPTFVSRNFTDAEITYCRAQPSPTSSFAARWAGKEAVFKSLGVKSSGAAAPMKDIEILNNADGVPSVQLHGEAKEKAQERGVAKILISLSHSEVSNLYFL
jgi:fatty acid synthase subunit beta